MGNIPSAVKPIMLWTVQAIDFWPENRQIPWQLRPAWGTFETIDFFVPLAKILEYGYDFFFKNRIAVIPKSVENYEKIIWKCKKWGNVLSKTYLSPNWFVKLYPPWYHRVNIPCSNRTRTFLIPKNILVDECRFMIGWKVGRNRIMCEWRTFA